MCIRERSFNATTGLQHKKTHVRILNRTDRTDDRIIFQILIYLILLTDTAVSYTHLDVYKRQKEAYIK